MLSTSTLSAMGEQTPVPNRCARRGQQAKEDRAAMDLPFSFLCGHHRVHAWQAVPYYSQAALSFIAASPAVSTKPVWRGWEIPGSAGNKLLLHSLQHHSGDLGLISLGSSWFASYIALSVNYPSHGKLRGFWKDSFKYHVTSIMLINPLTVIPN